MLKQTMLMYTTTNYVNNNKTQNNPQQNPAQATATSQPRQLAPAPLGRGAYGLTFGGGRQMTLMAALKHIWEVVGPHEAKLIKKENPVRNEMNDKETQRTSNAARRLLLEGDPAGACAKVYSIPPEQRSELDRIITWCAERSIMGEDRLRDAMNNYPSIRQATALTPQEKAQILRNARKTNRRR